MNRCSRYAVLTMLLTLHAAGAWADKVTTVWFAVNEDAANPVACTASTVMRKKHIKRNEPMTWKLKSDPDDKCPGFDPTLVELRFSTDVVGSGAGRTVSGKANGTAKSRVTTDPKVAPNDSTHPYKVYYDGKLAEDPELDVKGDMPPRPKPVVPGKPKK